ncbi:GDSL-type esterase/lipase family protein [Kitasatospora sp. NBC_01266]|uniref:GDSL-type esterase/lipase family protein n=1 Tax=Kitasatospora sp. NBC_01266 TaxID=2903572 RepID=UPI002E2FFE8F|nr:SGNH/GDSL hydrolase family protein [Kitasatospora sp. NBC_01266]
MPEGSGPGPAPRAAGRIPAASALLRFRGAVSLERYDDWVAPWRIPHRERDLYLPERGTERGAFTAGVRLTLRTDSSWLSCRYRSHPPPDMGEPKEVARVDVCCDGRLVATVELATDGAESSFRVAGLPAGSKRVELWLPCYNRFELRELEVAPDAEVTADDQVSPRWVHYGSSISNGRGATSPGRAWHALLARSAGLDLTSVGLGGVCHLQPAFARLIRDTPADLLTCCIGINVCKYGTHNARSFSDALIGFLQIVREGHPGTPLVVTSAIHSPRWEDAPGAAGLTLPEYREFTRRAVAALRRHGDRDLHYVDGLQLFGPADEHLMLEPPGSAPLHLGPRGHVLFASRLRRALRELAVPALTS